METPKKEVTGLVHESDSCARQNSSPQISDPKCPRETVSVAELLNECYGGWIES